jgi:hypothetical protein
LSRSPYKGEEAKAQKRAELPQKRKKKKNKKKIVTENTL